MSMLLRGQDSIDEVLRLSKDHDSIEKLNETQESEDSIEYTKEKESDDKDEPLDSDSLIKRGAEALATIGLIAVTTE